MKRWAATCFGILFCLHMMGQARVTRTPLIFDTDMGPDYDDVGAISLLHAFADSGRIRILGTMASDRYEGVAAVLNVFNTYFRRPELPIGVAGEGAVDERDRQHWTDSILAAYPHQIKKNSEALDAVGLYRRLLSGEKDHSVVIVTVGFLTNLSGLLKSEPDKWSSLTGEELVRKKVRRLVCMAGAFPAGREFNVHKDAAASKYVFEHWPANILFSGFEIGRKIKCGLPIVRNEGIRNNPVKDVFRISMPLAEEDREGRMSWDETAVLVAASGYASYYTVRRGRIQIAEDGSNTWQDDAKGRHFYLVENRPVGVVRGVIDDLIMHRRKAPFDAGVHRIVFLGNSITYDGKYVVDIATYLTTHYPGARYEIIDVGLPSETVSGLSEPGHAGGQFPRPDLHERLARVLALTKPDLVFAGYGMNDGIYMPFDEERFLKYREGLKWLHDTVGVPFIHMTPAVYDEQRGGAKGYAAVMDRYAAWVLSQRDSLGWKVADVYGPMKQYLDDHRRLDPGFGFAHDGVHPDSLGHWIMARSVLKYLGEKISDEDGVEIVLNGKDPAIFKLVSESQQISKDAWLTAAGHKRPGMNKGLPLGEAKAKCAGIQQHIRELNK